MISLPRIYFHTSRKRISQFASSVSSRNWYNGYKSRKSSNVFLEAANHSSELQYHTNLGGSQDENYKDYRSERHNRQKLTLLLPTIAIISLGFIKTNEILCEYDSARKEENIHCDKNICCNSKEGNKNESDTDKNLRTTASSINEGKVDLKNEKDQTISSKEIVVKKDSKTDNSSSSSTSSSTKLPGNNLPVLSKSDQSKKKSSEKSPLSKCKDFADSPLSVKAAIDSSRAYLNRRILEAGAPGITVAVSVDGENVWTEGIGFQDVENHVRMSSYTVLRIASISKSLTMAAVAQLIEEGKLNLDEPVQKYVPDFPRKFVDGKEVIITTRQLLSHTSGIRHYSLKGENDTKKTKENEKKNVSYDAGSFSEEKSVTSKQGIEEKVNEKREKLKKLLIEKVFQKQNEKVKDKRDEFELEEYYIKEHFNNIKEALKLFEDDDLLFKPGESFSYTTHGWTLVSAVIEGASGKSYMEVMKDLLKKIGMQNTYFEKNDDIIYRRARHYIRTKKAVLKNAPFVDNSYKWAGGGLISTVLDLAKFGNAMLYSFQVKEEDVKAKTRKPGILKRSTMKEMWTPSPNTKLDWDKEVSYALGWAVVEAEESPAEFCKPRRFCVSHTGAAVGASSILLIYPREQTGEQCDPDNCWCPPQGVVVAIITNMQSVGLYLVAMQIANIFSRVEYESKVLGSINGSSKNKLYSLNCS